MHEIAKQQLEAQLDQVTAELQTIAIYHEESDDWEARFDSDLHDEADEDLISDNAEAAEEVIATLALLETQFRNITRALSHIATGDYGNCEICGQAIEADRLAVNPAARTCKAHLNDEIDLPL
ncbi:MAG: hypothetical protein RLZZ360_694 [Candidatus Parcubacteria bacterium]|jgi:RNA polymerase-binding transcription factor DksA